jgi:cupin 2 domain-containing protein
VTGNLLADLPDASRAEITEILATGRDLRIERIVSRGQGSPSGFWYDQDEHEWVAVLAGSAVLILRMPDERLTLGPGDHALIPAHRPHRIETTAPDTETVWLAVFFRD